MKRTFAILFASTALVAAIGLPAWSAMHGSVQFEGSRDAALAASRDSGASPVLVGDHDDGDRRHGRRLRHGGDDDDHDEGDGEDDDESRPGNSSGPAPAGSVAPPQNGLFGSGAAPKVQVN
ncbi:hypothetical protein KEU06_23575 [Pseudaminobacter sp. 19-2017]|uniref:Uncharacterized protein n=1 Tax=Pseudaminobacter soli (ex Zhang et al. 2022) TaxID=2831468 RepID=A0A942I4A2_9HYPH|nr:hypothetical protein [Pseudaminobacter soli]MBS3651603.1 hypothetical protein [Pseudaminobacter soli]